MASSKHQTNFLDLKPGELNRYIDENLQPDQGFHMECSRNMDYLANYLKNKSKFHVAETIKGGSLGKGTAIKGKSDLDVVMYISNRFQDMKDFLDNIKKVIMELENDIRRWSEQKTGVGRVRLEGTTPHAVKMCIQYSKLDGAEEIDVDLLPAFDILKDGKNTAYHRMSNLAPREREYFSAGLASLQLEFVRKQTPNVKNLIRLVKYWRKTELEEENSVPTSYVLELLTIYAWEKAGSPLHFQTAKAFKSILKILKDYQNINVFWTENYNKQTYRNTATKQDGRPFILDPANPFNDVCSRFRGWDTVAQVAERSMKRPLLNTLSVQCRGMEPHGYNWN